MAARRLSGWLVGVTLNCGIIAAHCALPPDNQSALFSVEAFARAANFIDGTARPLDRALFAQTANIRTYAQVSALRDTGRGGCSEPELHHLHSEGGWWMGTHLVVGRARFRCLETRGEGMAGCGDARKPGEVEGVSPDRPRTRRGND
jgi:hypothetical protein